MEANRPCCGVTRKVGLACRNVVMISRGMWKQTWNLKRTHKGQLTVKGAGQMIWSPGSMCSARRLPTQQNEKQKTVLQISNPLLGN